MAREFDDDDLRDAMLGYLAEHPHAVETFDGIADWWITRYRIRVDIEGCGT